MSLTDVLAEEIGKRGIRADAGQFYLVSVTENDGLDIRCSALRSVGRTDRGLSCPEIVVDDSGRRGFRKDTRAMDDSDDAEIVVNLWGRLIGLPMAEEYRVFDRDLRKDSLLSMDVASPGWAFRELRRIREDVEETVRTGRIAAEPWMDQWRRVCLTRAFPEIAGNVENVCESEEDYRIAIEIPLYIMDCVFPDCGEARQRFRRQYFQMILFDLFIGQTDRTMHNYGLLTRAGGDSFRLAPLFDNATLSKPYLPENIYSLNGAAADKKRLLGVLLRDYGGYTVPAAERILAVRREKGLWMDRLSGSWIDNYNLALLREHMTWFTETFREIVRAYA